MSTGGGLVGVVIYPLRLNPVTAGPEGDEPSPLDHMTEEEMEQEAGKLVELFDKLDRCAGQLMLMVLPCSEVC